MLNSLFDVKEWCLNPYNGVHGGAICTLFDTGLGMGAVAITQKMVSTTDISVSFFKADERKALYHQGRVHADRQKDGSQRGQGNRCRNRRGLCHVHGQFRFDRIESQGSASITAAWSPKSKARRASLNY